jgi:hypothetical protein
MDKRDAERRARMAEEVRQREIANAAKRKQAEERIASECPAAHWAPTMSSAVPAVSAWSPHGADWAAHHEQ